MTAPVKVAELDAAMAADSIARRSRRADQKSQTDTRKPAAATAHPRRNRPGFGALASGAAGLVVVAALVYSVVKVSDESMRPFHPAAPPPSQTEVAAPPPQPPPVAAPPVDTPAALPPPPAPAPQAAPSPEAPPPPPPAAEPPQLVAAQNATVQTMVAPPPPVEPVPDLGQSLRERLRDRFPQLFPDP